MYKIFSHNDLDGYSINVVARYYNLKVDIKNINNKLVDQELMNFFNSPDLHKYKKIFLCDVYPSEEIAEYIDKNIDNFVLIDHHKTGEFLNKYSWAHIDTHYKGKPACATQLFYHYLINNREIDKTEIMDTYVESIRLFDTGEYMRERYSSKYCPNELSILFFVYFRNYWRHILPNLKKGYILSYSDVDVTTNMKNKIEMYSKQKQKEVFFIDFEGHETGVFFLEESLYISKILTDMHNIYPEIQLFMFINIPNTISLRSFGEVNVSKLAEKYKGGGHEMAAGFPYDTKFVKEILDKKD